MTIEPSGITPANDTPGTRLDVPVEVNFTPWLSVTVNPDDTISGVAVDWSESAQDMVIVTSADGKTLTEWDKDELTATDKACAYLDDPDRRAVIERAMQPAAVDADQALRWFTAVWSDTWLLGELATKLTCDEADALAWLLGTHGYPETALGLLTMHAEGDEPDDKHHTPCPECGTNTAVDDPCHEPGCPHYGKATNPPGLLVDVLATSPCPDDPDGLHHIGCGC